MTLRREADNDSAVYSDHIRILFFGVQFPTSVPYIEGYIIRYYIWLNPFYPIKLTLRILLSFSFVFLRRVKCKIKRKINNLGRCYKAMKKPDNQSELFSYYFKESKEKEEKN